MKARTMTLEQVAAHQAKMGKPLGDRIYREPAPKKRAKYGNEPVIVDGVRMASKREAKRYRELGLLLKSGAIDFLCRQPRFMLPGGIQYLGDFLYGSICPNKLICEDVKGVRTQEYKLKKKLMLSTHEIEIKET